MMKSSIIILKSMGKFLSFVICGTVCQYSLQYLQIAETQHSLFMLVSGILRRLRKKYVKFHFEMNFAFGSLHLF
jgi:hypothetical protein